MKVKSLFIKDYNQFKDFELDLTYPKGHKKEGQPLDKVCIIGQSGTGKTTLLTTLQSSIYRFTINPENNLIQRNYGANTRFEIQFGDFVLKDTISYPEQLILESEKNIISYLSRIRHNSIMILADQNANFKKLEEETVSQKEIADVQVSKYISITPQNFIIYWALIKNEVKTFQINLLNKRNEFSKLVTDIKTPQIQIQKEVQKLRDWEEKQVNPLKKLADECLDKILNHFNSKIKTEVDFEDIGFIKVETLQGKEVTNDILSTGIKQILFTAIPLYALKPENSIILFDEPERSLYPDIQTKIIDFYTSLGKNCQFFFATHSPLIASSFEPWEIVELKFNEEGNVYREKYFEGENHVDNYKFYPEYLRYDTILSKVFDMPNEANQKRRKVLDEIAILEKQLKNGASQVEKETLWKEYKSLQKKVSWEEDDEKY